MRRKNSVSISMPAPLLTWMDSEAAAYGKSRSAWVVWLVERERDGRLSERVQILEKTINRIKKYAHH